MLAQAEMSVVFAPGEFISQGSHQANGREDAYVFSDRALQP